MDHHQNFQSNSCECGHHDHDHGHCSDHDHNHHHHSQKSDGIHISHHEEALVGSLRGELPNADFQQAQAVLTEQIRCIGQKVSDAGGIIGHVKFILRSPEHCCQVSLTDVAENVRYFDTDTCKVEGVAIVFHLEDAVLHQILQETLGSVLQFPEE